MNASRREFLQSSAVAGSAVLADNLGLVGNAHAQGPDVIPIPGTKRKERLLENLGALAVTLSNADIAEIAAAIPPGAAAGTRYPEPQMTSVFL